MRGLAEFLKARLDEDERLAKGALPYWEGETDYDLARLYAETQDHVRHLTPARALREVEAKQQLLDEHGPHEHYPDYCRTCWAADSCGCVAGMDYPCDTVRMLAAVYADHPDYREEWRP